MPFPRNFLWGVSESGFQFEMGDSSRKGLDENTDWFVWVHDRYNLERRIVSGDLPEDGPNYWYLYKEDHVLASQLGLNSYRLGIEWSRIFPNPTREVRVEVRRNEFNRISSITGEESFLDKLDKIADTNALRYYREIILDIISKGMKPIICLNHFTLPLWIHNPFNVKKSKGRVGPRGWLDEDTIIEFWKFAAYLAWKLGDLVDSWATLNEPNVVAEAGYLFPEWGFPPGLNNFKFFKRCLINQAVAHARAYDAIKQFDNVKADESSGNPAEVGVILNIIPMEPYDKSRDVEASLISNHIHNMFFIEAVSNGWLDQNLNMKIDEKESDSSIGGRIDWIGVNYYTRNVVKKKKSIAAKIFAGISVTPEIVEGYGNNCKPNSFSLDHNPSSDFGWEIYPIGLASSLKLMAKFSKPLYVTENGIADSQDILRPKFIIDHLRVLEKIIAEDKIDVRGYFHWALIDNYEWARGFKMKFGLCSVDMQTKKRKPRGSYYTYRDIILSNEVS